MGDSPLGCPIRIADITKSKADTCQKYITPKLLEAGWQETDQIREQVTFTHGRIVPTENCAMRKMQKRFDYLLYYRRDFPLAVVEANEEIYYAADRLPQGQRIQSPSQNCVALVAAMPRHQFLLQYWIFTNETNRN